MKPGDIVICTDARLSEGRLKEGWRYVVMAVNQSDGFVETNPDIPMTKTQIQVFGTYPVGDAPVEYRFWKSSRFRLLTKEDIILSAVADKLLSPSSSNRSVRVK